MIKNWIKKIKDKFENKAIVLMYHRIAVLETDPWQLSVSPQNFEEQLIILKRNFNVISVNELVQSIKAKKVLSKSVCITFDDGYTDNFLFAKPLLEKYNLPATFFIPSNYIGEPQRFWWDELEQIILHSSILPQKLSLNIENKLFEFADIEDTLNADLKEKHKLWIWSEKASTRRCELYLALWKCLQPLPYELINNSLKKIRTWSNYNQLNNPEECAMDLRQLKSLINNPLFNVGVHTLTHPALSFHSKDSQHREIIENRLFIEKISNKKINHIAFPYGNYNSDTLSITKENNFSAAFTTAEQLVTNASDPLLLGRYQVKNVKGDEFNTYLKYITSG